MDKSKRELESVVASQKEQLTRYETRLKDVVTAYKGLLKEKEALEASLAAVSGRSPAKKPASNGSQPAKGEKGATAAQDGAQAEAGGGDDLQAQIATLMNSLATLSAEKSRQEASFQADRRQLRQELTIKDKMIKDLQERVKQAGAKQQVELEQHKSKLIVLQHDRDKEAQDHMVMVRELQKLLADERHLKESLEMQLNDLKTQFSQNSAPDKAVRELTAELDEAKRALKQYENSRPAVREETKAIFHQLQQEMQMLKQQHAVAIRNEQKRAQFAEETNRKLAALHEERVISLEARLSELSNTVGTYDRLRQQDQENIAKLKDKIARLSVSRAEEVEAEKKSESISDLIDQILQLKKKLVVENARSSNPIDLSSIFASPHAPNELSSADSVPLLDYKKLKFENERLLEERDVARFTIEEQKVHIKTLQEKVKVLNRNIEEHESELKGRHAEFGQVLKGEKQKWRNAMGQLETEYRSKAMQLENELQKQRERSLQLLDEKENEIKTLKTSFEIFIPGNAQLMNSVQQQQDGEGDSDGEVNFKSPAAQLSNVLNSKASGGTGESFHILHYAHELARKKVEIANLRKARHTAETSLRQALHEKVTIQEELHDKISNLEDEVDRLNRYQSREGANLEYLKNVVLSYLVSKDPDSRKHMLNAIGAVLKFTPTEMNSISTFLMGKK